MAIISAILTSSVSDTLAYILVTIGVFITLRVLMFPDLTVDGSFVTGGSIAALMIAGGYSPFLATLAALRPRRLYRHQDYIALTASEQRF